MNTAVKHLLSTTLVSVSVMTIGLSTYDRLIVKPRQRLGVVDVTSIYRAKEDEYARVYYQFSPGEQGSSQGPAGAQVGATRATQLAQDFAQRLPRALSELSQECQCVIVTRGAVATLGVGMVDFTPALRVKLGMRQP